jgi:uncharacterized protein (TIGR02145 family)
MKVCPTGWHLPSFSDWNKLIDLAESGKTSLISNAGKGGNRLKSRTEWGNVSTEFDGLGFSALPAGYYITEGFDKAGYHTNFWTSTTKETTHAYSMYLENGKSGASIDYYTKNNGYSVRCILDD